MKRFKKALPFLIIIILWQVLSMSKIVSEYLLPSPARVFEVFMEMLKDGSLLADLKISVLRVLIGFSFALILAFLFATVFYLNPKLYQYFEGLFQFMKNVPPLSLIPLLILWMGIGEGSKIIMIILASFFPLFLNIQKGFVITNNELIEVGKVFSYSDMEIFRHIVLPSALKDIFTGIRIALGYAWRSIIAAEMIAASSGLGYRINFARQMSRTDKVIVGIIAIGLFGWITDFIFVKIANHFLKGDLKNEWYKS